MARGRPPLVDAHMHLWDLERLSYPWLTPPFTTDGPNGDVGPIAHTFRLEDYEAQAQSWEVTGLVHVEAGAATAQALAETRWLQDVAERARVPMALVAYAPLHDPQVERLLAAHADSPAVRGVRQILNWHPDPARTYTARDRLDGDEDFARGYALLARYGLGFDLQIYPAQMRAAAELAGRHPDTPVILNHAGMPLDRTRAGLEVWRAGLRALAEHPHVSIKLSGFGIVDPAWSVESIRPLVLEAIDIFGPDRVMFASDVPTDTLHASFDRIIGAYDEITTGFSDDERRQLFGGNALRIYRVA